MKSQFPVLIDIPDPPIDDNTGSPEVIGTRRHQTAPAGRVEALGLLDVHDFTSLIVVGKVSLGLRRSGVAHFYHFDRDSWADDLVRSGAMRG